jgi:hypothetical protein
VLLASDDHFRSVLADGQEAFDTPTFAPWYQAFANDMTDVNARIQALTLLGPVNNDQVDTWFADDSQLATDCHQWAAQALMAEPGSVTDQMTTLAKAVQSDLILADKDAVAVGA